LSSGEIDEIKEQIEFYKKHRRTLQYGKFFRIEQPKDNKVCWSCVSPDGNEAVAGIFQTLAVPSESADKLTVLGLNEMQKYDVKSKKQGIFLRKYGVLIKHLMRFVSQQEDANLPTGGTGAAGFALPEKIDDANEQYIAFGKTLKNGIVLTNQFMGTEYHPFLHLWGDFGSTLYTVESIKN
jgi:alpha-galactosidase